MAAVSFISELNLSHGPHGSQFGSEEFGEFHDISIEAFSEYEIVNNRNKKTTRCLLLLRGNFNL